MLSSHKEGIPWPDRLLQAIKTLDRVQQLTIVDLKNKSIFELLGSAIEELGEFARELQIEEAAFGNTYKQPDEGSKAEAADVVICALALFFARGGTEKELVQIMNNKLNK